jgi:hypothetical protein
MPESLMLSKFFSGRKAAMKSRISLPMACFFLLTAVAVFGAGEVSKSGTLVAFTGTSLTLRMADQAGRHMEETFYLHGGTDIKRLDQEMAWFDIARKGLSVQVVSKDGWAEKIQVPFYGLEAQGKGIRTNTPGIYGIVDVRSNRTDSILAVPSERKNSSGLIISKVEVEELEPELDDAWALAKADTIMIGNLGVIEGSAFISVDNIPLSILYAKDGAGTFLEPAGSSCIVDFTKSVTTIKFDLPLGKNYTEASERVKVLFRKRMFRETATEITYLELDPHALVEVNGVSSSIDKALDMANFWLIRCNTDNRLVHVDSYFVDRRAKIYKVADGELALDAGGPLAVFLSPGVTVLGAEGEGSLADLTEGMDVHVTTEPADAYRAVLIAAHH